MTPRGMSRWDGVVIHIAEGYYEGTISWQKNPDANVSSHFVVAKSGKIAQVVDTADAAWTQRDGNGEWLSIENEGFLPDRLTDAQLNANARILAKAHQVYDVPLVVTNTPRSRGLGHHSMGAENGYHWGHSQCPGANIKAQKSEIVTRAKKIIAARGDWFAMATQAELEQAVINAMNRTTPYDAEGPRTRLKDPALYPPNGWSDTSVAGRIDYTFENSIVSGKQLTAALVLLTELAGKDLADEAEIARLVIAGLGSVNLDDAVTALKAAFGDRVPELAAKLIA